MRILHLIALIFFSIQLKAVVIGSNDLGPVNSGQTPLKIQKIAKAVGHVKTSYLFPSRCSGFLVSESLFVTTTDCVPSFLTPGRIKVYFNNLTEKNSDRFKVDEIVMRDGPTDLVLLRLKNSPGIKQGFLKVKADLLKPGTQLTYIENDSNTYLLQYMTKPCTFEGYSGDEAVVHDCDTTTVQGAPLMNQMGEVVGMQYGFYFTSPVRNSAISAHLIEPLINFYR